MQSTDSDFAARFGMDRFKPTRYLNRRNWYCLAALVVIAVIVGVNVEVRGALIHNRHTDAGVYFSAAWAVRIGSDPYSATDRNGWHLMYPPLLAVLLTPLADAPPTMHRYWLLPYAVSVGLWFLLSMLGLVLGVDQLARALLDAISRQTGVRAVQGFSPDSEESVRRWSWRWWTLFFWPIFLCVPAICRSVIRGQVGPVWVMLICMTIVCIIRKRPLQAGLWLSGAICLKLIPAFLLLYPLYRRSWRMLGGAMIGLALGLLIIPMAAMGPRQFVTANQHYLHSVVLPGLTGKRIDPIVEHELVDPVTSDTQSFVAVLMNTGNFFFDTERSYNPPIFARAGGYALAAILLLGILWAAGGSKTQLDPLDEALFFSILSVILLPLAPACHPHYFMVMIPPVMAVLATFLGARGQVKVRTGWVILLAMLPISHLLTGAPGQQWVQVLRDTGMVLWTAIAFCIAATLLLYRRQRGLAPFAFPALPQFGQTGPMPA